MPNNIVTRIALEGGDEVKLQLTGIGQAGTLAFTRLKAAAAGVKLDNVAKGSEQFATAGQRAGQLSNDLKDLQDSVKKLTNTFPPLAQAAGRFAQRITLVGGAAVAAGLGLAAAARNIVKQSDGQSDALEKQTAAQVDANNAALSGQLAQIGYGSSIRKLNQQLVAGTITYTQFQAAVKQLNQDFAEQQRVARETANAQDAVKEANDRLQKSLKDRQAYTQLADTFGGPLLSSLISFGRQVEQVRQSFIQDFGPAAAKLVDLISTVVGKNSSAISGFFAQASAKITTLLTKNGPQIEKFLTNIGKAAASVFNGLIDGAPAVIDFFNNQIVPAVTRVAGFFDGLATAINSVFGTKLTGGSLVILAVFAQMTGSIRILFALTRSLNGAWKAFGEVVVSAGRGLTTLFGGGKIANSIVKLGASVATSGGIFSSFFSIIRAGITVFVLLATVVASTFGIPFSVAAVAILALAAALGFLLSKVDWTAFLAATQTAIASALVVLSGLVQGAKDVIAVVIAAFVTGWAAISAAWTTGNKAITDAWQVVVDFFAQTWALISQGVSDLMTAVVAFFVKGFADATATVKGWFDSVMGFFAAILAKAAAVGSAISGALGGASDGGSNTAPQSNAAGGHIRGKGTGTSDSILSWLSNGEYVIKARAVAKYGTAFLNAVNAGNLNLPGFSTGGLASMAQSVLTPSIPRFANGGFVSAPALAGGGRPMVLQIGDTSFSGLTADDNAMTALSRFAAGKTVRSAGRKPLWYKD